jgi:hypothetical protein
MRSDGISNNRCAVQLSSSLGHMQMLPNGDVCPYVEPESEDSESDERRSLSCRFSAATASPSGRALGALSDNAGLPLTLGKMPSVKPGLAMARPKALDLITTGSKKSRQMLQSFSVGQQNTGANSHVSKSKSFIHRAQSEVLSSRPHRASTMPTLPDGAVPDMRSLFANECKLQDAQLLSRPQHGRLLGDCDPSLMPSGNSAFEPKIEILQDGEIVGVVQASATSGEPVCRECCFVVEV